MENYNQVQTYALHDTDPSAHGGAFRIKRSQAHEYNSKGFGIFHTVQSFFGPRQKSHLVGLNAWFVDVDGGDKASIMKRIESGLLPTQVVETKNGYHVYWRCVDATLENWNHIVVNRLIPFYDGDKKAKDLARILRTPGFMHLKNPLEPFPVRVVMYNKVQYTESQMLKAYKDLVTPKKQAALHRKTKREHPEGSDFFERLWNFDCKYALETLSGSEIVSGECYTFHTNASGTQNIYVNGKSSSCWIDKDGRIGSLDEGGPTIAQWLRYYGHEWSAIIDHLKKTFPELNKEQITEQPIQQELSF